MYTVLNPPIITKESFSTRYMASTRIAQDRDSLASQSVSQSINQSINQSVNQSISQSVNQSINQSIFIVRYLQSFRIYVSSTK